MFLTRNNLLLHRIRTAALLFNQDHRDHGASPMYVPSHHDVQCVVEVEVLQKMRRILNVSRFRVGEKIHNHVEAPRSCYLYNIYDVSKV